MNTRNLFEITHPAMPWLLVPAALGALIALIVLVAAAPVVAAVVAVVASVLLWVAFFRMGRRS